ncbi:MAG: flagellar basal-body MS-ring/collar protein FliF [Syntrophomonadaceae bacterium]|jgi:flagellar M-ring protein FliF|nr:flagellar basal-body MS-ring/collar protein FliF [Syntrophomonadaceae bacterium]
MEEGFANLRQWWQKLAQRWTSLTLNQKVLVTGAAVLLLAAVVMAFSPGLTQRYEPLYSGLTVEDAAAIAKKLDSLKQPYRLGDEGTTILVPAADKYRVRLSLASEGLPAGTSGLELFQTSNFGETETDKKVKYLAAMQGELVRTIQSLNKVASARVHLVMPQPSLYSEKDNPATASVMVAVREGQRLSEKEVLGIVNLVAHSVEGLSADNVVVVDQYGTLLTADLAGGSLGSASLSAQQLDIKRAYEREKQLAAQSMLDATLGQGKAVVRVNADLNFDSIERFSQDFDPDQRVVVSKHELEESSTGSSGSGASPGVDANIPSYTSVSGGGTTASTTEKTDRTVNYEGDKVETRTTVAPGSVERITVAVLVDSAFSDRSEDIRDAVRNAIGVDERRNDSVSVNFMDFSAAATEAPVEGPGLLERLSQYTGLLAVIALFVLGLVALNMFRRSLAEGRLEPGFEAVIGEEIPVSSILERELTPEEKEKQKIRGEIDRMIEQKPEDVAQIIRTWMSEDSR